jgi:VWFA-related protein
MKRHGVLPVDRNASAALLPVYRNALAALLPVYRNALAALLVGLVLVLLVAVAPAAQQQAGVPAQTADAPQQAVPAPPSAPAPASTPAPQTVSQPDRAAFRTGVDIVSLNVTVTDGANHYVTDLAQNDFAVFEDGVRQEVTFFTRRTQPIALSLLLDSSASMEDKLPTLQAAASSFVRRMKANDIAQVIDFDSRVDVRQAFSGNQTDLIAAIDSTAAGGSTSLHNAIYIALKELRKVRAVSEEDVRRQALIVFSDGEDTSSLVSFDEVLDLAKRSETSIYAIALRGVDTQTKGFREAEYVMKTLAQETGGRAFFPAKLDDLNGVYAQIADELASQYTIGYSSKNGRRDGAWRRIIVQVTRPNVTPRAKRGYYAPTAR